MATIPPPTTVPARGVTITAPAFGALCVLVVLAAAKYLAVPALVIPFLAYVAIIPVIGLAIRRKRAARVCKLKNYDHAKVGIYFSNI